MQDSNLTNSNKISNEVEVDLNVLGPLMLNRAGGHVNGTDVVGIHQCGTA